MTDASVRLAQVNARIAKAAALAGRNPADVTLIAVTKGQSVDSILPLIDAGHRHFGESRVQEAQAKWPVLIAAAPDIRLHCIGRLQSNKADEASRLFNSVHSLDRTSLLDALAGTPAADRPSSFVQVNIGDEKQKGGCAIDDAGTLVESVRGAGFDLAGLMCIPPADLEPGPYFALLAELARRHDVTGLSMGMSADFEAAIMLGATHVRVGSALFEDA